MRFMKNYGRVAPSAPAYAMNDEFSRVLHQQMEFFSSNPSADTINRVRGEVGEASFSWFTQVYFVSKLLMFPLSYGHVLGHMMALSSRAPTCRNYLERRKWALSVIYHDKVQLIVFLFSITYFSVGIFLSASKHCTLFLPHYVYKKSKICIDELMY